MNAGLLNVVVLTFVVAACTTETIEAPLDPTLDAVQDHVLTPACATGGCHDAPTRAGELVLATADDSFASLVNVAASNPVANETGWVRVKPFDPDLSFLMRKIDGPGVGEGAPMPVGDLALTDPYCELVGAWIEDGALR